MKTEFTNEFTVYIARWILPESIKQSTSPGAALCSAAREEEDLFMNSKQSLIIASAWKELDSRHALLPATKPFLPPEPPPRHRESLATSKRRFAARRHLRTREQRAQSLTRSREIKKLLLRQWKRRRTPPPLRRHLRRAILAREFCSSIVINQSIDQIS